MKRYIAKVISFSDLCPGSTVHYEIHYTHTCKFDVATNIIEIVETDGKYEREGLPTYIDDFCKNCRRTHRVYIPFEVQNYHENGIGIEDLNNAPIEVCILWESNQPLKGI